MLIDRFVPKFDVRERHRVHVAASPDRVWEALHQVDMGRSRVIRALFRARGIPRTSFRLDDLAEVGIVRLGETPGEEVVFGIVGRFWTVRGGLVAVDAHSFSTFEEPGYAKGAWNFRVTPRFQGAATDLATETRVICTDDVARRRFMRYWRLIRPWSGVIRQRALIMIKREADAASA